MTRARAASVLMPVAVLAACVSLKRTPQARFFVLRSLAAPPSAPAATASQGFVGVLTVRLPGHLDRPQLVAWTGPGELRIDEFRRWGEPLDEGFTRTLTENLQALLPDHLVARAPWRANVAPRCRVATELSVFGLQPGGEVRLEGRWALLPPSAELPLARGSATFKRGPLAGGLPGADPDAEIAAMSELVADLSRDIAAATRALPPAEETRR